MPERTRSIRYALFFGAPILIAFALLGLSWLVLARAGETIGPVAAARLQQNEDVRYSSALFYRPRPYKIERASLVQADMILLGSSRAMQFLSAPWRIQAYNAGGAMRDMESGEIFADAVLEHYHPRSIIIVADWWWFSNTRRPDGPNDASPETPITLHELAQPAVWLWKGSLAPQDLRTLLFAPGLLGSGIGVPALFNGAGWDRFGHYFYGAGLTRATGGSDPLFSETLRDIARKSKRNDRAPWNTVSETSWHRFAKLLQRFKASGVEAIVVLPPVAPPVFDWIAAQPEPNIVNEIRRRLKTLPAQTYDFHDPASIDTTACEFVDGIHGGEVTYLRLLAAMADDPNSHLKGVIDRELIRRLVDANAGRATLRENEPGGNGDEADFLGLGCKK